MPNTNVLFKVFRNKYVIALTSFIVFMLFIDHNDMFLQLKRQQQLKELIASKKFYEKQIQQTRKNLSDLQNNPAALEKYAREKYFLKRDNEDLFIVSSSTDTKK